MNLPQVIGVVVSSRLATMVELDTVLGIEDAYNMLEILTVDAYNRKLASEVK